MTELAYQGYADPGEFFLRGRLLRPRTSTGTGSRPRRRSTRSTPAKAKQVLADAGYKDTDGDGILNDPKNGGKNIKLRLWSRQESPQSQVMGKLIAGWWEELGLGIEYSVEDNGALIAGGYNYDGDTYKPDYDIYIWACSPAAPTPAAVWATSAPCRSRTRTTPAGPARSTTHLWEQQSQELDPQARKEIAYQMQEILHQASPYIVLTYPKTLQAWNTDRWEGWQRIRSPTERSRTSVTM